MPPLTAPAGRIGPGLDRVSAGRSRRSAHALPIAPLIALVAGLTAVPAAAEFPRLLRGLAAPFRAAHREAPPLPEDPCLDVLTGEVLWLEHHIDHYGSIVAKSPDVWGQNRLTRHRAEYEQQMRAQLDRFESRASAALRRSDQAFLGMAMALQSASGNRRRGEQVPVPAANTSSTAVARVEGLIPSTNEEVSRAGSGVIARSAPFALPAGPEGVSFGSGHLFFGFLADNGLKIADHRWVRVRACHGADAVERIAHVSHPIAQGVVHCILQRPAS